ncbi:MAG TPA: hypothetical protein VFZ26_12465 [Gemmatimonadales bacterium]
MFPGSPVPLGPRTPLAALLAVVPPLVTAGVWLRHCPRVRVLHAPGQRHLLLCRDLGTLLRRCDHVVVRHSGRLHLFSAAQLIRCRVLEVVLGTPYLPPPARLRELYPALEAGARRYAIPIGLGSAEEALALCAAERLPVRSSRVGYGAISG